jgi:hypothetical protein
VEGASNLPDGSARRPKPARWLVDVYETPSMRHVRRLDLAMRPSPGCERSLFHPRTQDLTFKQPFEPTPVRMALLLFVGHVLCVLGTYLVSLSLSVSIGASPVRSTRTDPMVARFK